ncbi:hypothetical protein BB560_006308 [Smittium megazygosporum]|uniref:Uncharacterized protein n=1 Tax=Smittium megazygosporum TaxID=133381 RepID=A0A2T9YAA8_9FUNG|nr:hypothetical protein BB560_006308 [Smittium megazygosporum]
MSSSEKKSKSMSTLSHVMSKWKLKPVDQGNEGAEWILRSEDITILQRKAQIYDNKDKKASFERLLECSKTLIIPFETAVPRFPHENNTKKDICIEHGFYYETKNKENTRRNFPDENRSSFIKKLKNIGLKEMGLLTHGK